MSRHLSNARLSLLRKTMFPRQLKSGSESTEIGASERATRAEPQHSSRHREWADVLATFPSTPRFHFRFNHVRRIAKMSGIFITKRAHRNSLLQYTPDSIASTVERHQNTGSSSLPCQSLGLPLQRQVAGECICARTGRPGYRSFATGADHRVQRFGNTRIGTS